MSSRTDLRTVLDSYLARHPTESTRLADVAAALDAVHNTPDPLPVTCSAVVVDRARRILHTSSVPAGPGLPGAKLRRGDRSPLATALRAVHDQTGIPPGDLCLTPQHLRTPIDIAPGPGATSRAPDAPIADLRFAFHLAHTPSTAARWQPTADTALAELKAKVSGLDGQTPPLNASALIYNSRGEYLLHLRDMRDGIWAPGCWALLGGGHEPGDRTPQDTILRELAEEAGIVPQRLEAFLDEEVRDEDGLTVPVRIFTALWEGDPAQLPLTEGVMLAWFPPATMPRLRLGGETLELVQRHARVCTVSGVTPELEATVDD
ncbi:NUDIX domain-containing protein [Streptomyces sp. TG1A-8]|uniref:NUDIX domain-containing protein n=1 Tax=Streptomyces sp. TG1A-8 TaxID=3051385 RepID=UPI00265C6E06|nr:NUDIX domain-containing protein [Streptomyces sp. TG1A-8]MDO0930043.1 NUDIX domain-containing protein [Streptomyces sp. TG1A-8]